MQKDLFSHLVWLVKKKIALLSCFDSIGSARLALEQLGHITKKYLSWEMDAECQVLIKIKRPEVVEMGHFDLIDVKSVWNDISKLLDEHTVLLITAGPPCKNFSRIRGTESPGKSGKESAKFVRFCKVAEPSFGQRLQFPIENVWPEDPETS